MLAFDKKMIFVAIGVVLLTWAIGAFMFLKDVMYYEKEQMYYMTLFGLLSLGVGYFTYRIKYVSIGLFVIPMIGILVFSSMKLKDLQTICVIWMTLQNMEIMTYMFMLIQEEFSEIKKKI